MKRNMKPPNRPLYVNLLESVRVAVGLMEDGEDLASKMTDNWIKGARRFWDSDDYSDDSPLMNQMYGSDWRAVRPRVAEAYRRALHVLDKVLLCGRVPGVGVFAAARRRAIGPLTRTNGLRVD
jgi:hypothetical protein